MKKIHNTILFSIVIILWAFLIVSNNSASSKATKYEKIGDEYYTNSLYTDAIYNYDKSLSIENKKSVEIKRISALISNEQYEKAFVEILQSNFNEEYIKENHMKILDILIENKDFKLANKLYNITNQDIKNLYNKKYAARFNIYDGEYENIIYSQSDNNFIVSNGNKYVYVNSKDRVISKKFDKILGSYNGMSTVVEDSKMKVIDLKNNERSSLENNIIGYFKEGYLVAKDDAKYFYTDRINSQISKMYEKASNFEIGKAVIKLNGVHIINNRFEIIESLEGDDFKIDQRNEAIVNNKVIIKKKDKFKIYDIKSKKYSSEYDEIDFSYGEFIAVREKGKWGYINQNYEIIEDFKYEHANSFSEGLAIVKVDNQYCIIDKTFKILDKYKVKILPFNKDGISFIKNNNNWKMIRLVRYIND